MVLPDGGRTNSASSVPESARRGDTFSCATAVPDSPISPAARRDILALRALDAGVVKLEDARDSKSRGVYAPCRFDSDLRHHHFERLADATHSCWFRRT